MASQKISQLTALTEAADADLFAIVDDSATATKKITKANLFGELNSLSDAEIQQIQNIGAVTITNAQWGYLGGLDQSLATTDSPTFDALTVTSIGGITQGNLLDKTAAETVTGTWTFDEKLSESNLNALATPWDDTGLVLYLPFDENTGTTASDKSHEGNDGSFKGAGEPAWSEGHRNTAVDFDGTDDYIQVSHDTSLNPGTGSFTYEFWFNADYNDQPESYPRIIAKGDYNTNGYCVMMKASDGDLWVAYNDENNNSAGGYIGTGYSDGEWHHLAAVLNRSDNTVKVYIDGAQEDSSDASSVGDINTTDGLNIGMQDTTHYFFKGKVDEIRMYQRALLAEEVKMHYLRT
jgi:hypothetical protein